MPPSRTKETNEQGIYERSNGCRVEQALEVEINPVGDHRLRHADREVTNVFELIAQRHYDPIMTVGLQKFVVFAFGTSGDGSGATRAVVCTMASILGLVFMGCGQFCQHRRVTRLKHDIPNVIIDNKGANR